MNKIKRRVSFGLGIISLLCSLCLGTAEAATRLTPAHLYDWARTGNITRLQQFKRYINLQDRNNNTALCLAQKAQDRNAYALLLKFGASTKVACHDDDDPICAVIAGEKTKIHPAAWWLLGAGAAGAYFLFDDDDDDPEEKCPTGYNTSIQTPADCGTQGASGWDVINNGEVDGVSCGKCVAKTCEPGTSTQKCQAGTFTIVDSEVIEGAAGEENCYRCTYACNNTTAFADQGTCEAGGYICTSVSENGQTCYRRTGSEQCPIEYPSEEPCTPSGNGFTTDQDQQKVGDTTCYKCTYQCASGWTAGSCPAGKTCEEITLPDNSGTCYRNAQCPADYPYTSETACTAGGYTCTESATGSGCWKRTGEDQCPTGFSTDYQSIADCGNGNVGANGWTFTTNGQSGGEVCGKCTPKTCPTDSSTTPVCSNGAYTNGSAVASDDYAGDEQCYTCDYVCNNTTAFSNQGTCEAGGYICTSVEENGQTCYRRTGSDECPIDYPYTSPCSGGNGYTFSQDQTTVGDTTCYKCTYQCASGWTAGSCPAGKTCEEITLPDNSGTCYRNAQCPADYPYTSETACTAGGYTCTESATGSGCWKRTGEDQCPTGFSTDYQSIADCGNGNVGANGWDFTANGQSGGKVCGKCEAKKCPTDSSTTPTCSNGTYTNGSAVASDDYAGDDQCYTCDYVCNNTTAFSNQGTCEAGGYICTSVTENGQTCYRRTGSDECPDGYPDTTPCSGGTGYTFSQEQTTVGDKTCYKCTYSCVSSWNSGACPTGKTCTNEITLPDNSGKCYLDAQCPSDYPYTNKTTCETGGYICTESATGSGCWKRTGNDQCPTGYDTAIQDPTDCGVGGAAGWKVETNGQSGGVDCGKCVALQCEIGTTTCESAGTGFTLTQEENGDYYGNTPCLTCNYACASNYYTSESACTNNGSYQCTSIEGHGLTCWQRGNAEQCETGSTQYQSVTDCGDTGSLGWSYSSSGMSGELKCGICDKLNCNSGYSTSYPNAASCGNIQGWTYTQDTSRYAGDEVCGKCDKKDCPADSSTTTCQAGTYTKVSDESVVGYHGEEECYSCSYACNNTTAFSDQSTCTSGGYTCSQVSENGLTCWLRGTPSQCPDGYTQGLEDCSSKTHPEGWTYSSNGQSGGEVCGKCEPKGCTTGSTSNTSVNSCGDGANPEGWDFSTNGYSGDSACGVCTPRTCDTGSTSITSVADCGSSGANGWTMTTVDYAGDTKCNQCNAKTCPTNTSTSQTCSSGTYTKGTAVASGDYAGNEQCYSCEYKCNNTSGYTTNSTCTSGGYTCTSVVENGITCYRRTGSEDCPSEYPDSSPCSGGNGYTFSQSSTTVGDNTCYKCTYSCASGWTAGSCPAGYTCNTISTPVQCYQKTGCSSEYPYTSQSSCTEGGYTCTESFSGSGCWKRGTATSCPSGYSTDYQSVADCGSTGANGWTFSSNGTSGGETCGKCTAKTCTTGSVNPTCSGNSYATSTAVNTGAYSGNNECQTCEYSCNNTTGFTSCPTGMICAQDSTSQCYYKTGCDSSAGYVDAGNTCACDNKYKFSSCPSTAQSCEATTCNGKYAIASCKDGYQLENYDCVSAGGMSLNNQTDISKMIAGEEDGYGLKSSEDIENGVDEESGLGGKISLSHYGSGTAYGMYGASSGTVTNVSGANIKIESINGGNAVGMYSNVGGTVTNAGTIEITGNAENAYGIYGEGQNTITNSGDISVEGKNAYGIYVKDGTGTTVTNTESGTITVNASEDGQAHGIYIDQNALDAKVNNYGTITVNGEVKAGQTGITLNGAELRNYSRMSFSGAADLNALDGKIYLEDGGVYEAESLEGELNIGTSTVMGGNQDTYVQEGSLQVDNADGLELASESALFTANKQQNADGSYDVVMNRRSFNEFTENASLGNYLEQNYKDGKLEELYDSIKSETNDFGARKNIADKTGFNTMLNFADENFQVMRSLNRNMADTILKPSDDPYRVIAGYDNYNLETDNEGILSGYELSSNSMYTFGDKRLDNKNRLGLGLSFTKLSTSYDDGGDRDLSIVNIFVPYLHKFTDNLRLASIASFGYGWGEYDRGAERESDITDIFYGLTNELRYTIDLNGFAELEPALMLNALGYSEDGFDEGSSQEALRTKRTNNLSVEGGIGLFLKKDVKMEKYGKLGFKVGGVYYHEFATPYDKIQAQHHGANGWYYINDYANLYQRDRAVLEAAIDYEYKDISLYAKYNYLIQKNDPQLFDLGVKYKF